MEHYNAILETKRQSIHIGRVFDALAIEGWVPAAPLQAALEQLGLGFTPRAIASIITLAVTLSQTAREPLPGTPPNTVLWLSPDSTVASPMAGGLEPRFTVPGIARAVWGQLFPSAQRPPFDLLPTPTVIASEATAMEEAVWQCVNCTFMNSVWERSCAMCR